ncbi:MAG: hypothetical protein J1F71_05635 [Clostridiales bacterium]|nr:hypothetical protein [Clostridiales bacterium]
MDREYIYEEDRYEEGLTFGKIGRFFQKSWLRMVVYLVIATLLVTVVAVPVKVYAKSEPIATTSIEYIYQGIEKGHDPNGAPLNTDNIISTTVLKNAVDSANLGKVIKDISILRSAMRVEGVLTDEYVKLAEAAANGDNAAANTLRNYNMFSTRFDIIISDPAELGLSDDQAKLLLNKVVAAYYADFQSRYSASKVFAENTYTLSVDNQLEFTEIYDIYLQSLDSVTTFLQDMIEEGGNFMSTVNDTTFHRLLSDINVLKSSYNQFNAYIISNNIWRDKQSAKSALEASKIDINNKLKPLEVYIQSLAEQISKIQPNTTTTDNGTSQSVTVSYPPEYFVYQAQLDEANRQVRDYNVQLNNIETRLNKLQSEEETDEAFKTQAASKLAEIEAKTQTLIKKVNATVEDYYHTTFVSSSVRQVQPPIVTRRSLDFNLLIVYLIGLIVALFAAGIVTAVKISRKKGMEKSETQGQTPTEENK